MKKTFKAIRLLLNQPGEKPKLAKYWFISLSFLLLIPNLALLGELIFNQPALAIGQRFGFVAGIYVTAFSNLFNPVIFTLMVLAWVIAFNFALIGFVRRKNKTSKGKLSSTLSVLVGSHCATCGTSLLSPLVSLFTGSGAYIGSGYSSLQIFTVAANLFAIAISLWSIHRVAPTVIRLAVPTSSSSIFIRG